MTKYLTLIFLILLQSVLNAEMYRCGDKLKDNICYLEAKEYIGESSSTFIYLRECPQGTKCSKLTIGIEEKPKPGYCVPYLTLLKEHEECSYDFECETKKCVGNRCVAASIGEDCKKDYECGNRAFCNNKKCQSLFSQGDTCIMYEDTEKDFSSVKSYCKLGSLCGEVQDGKKCVEMFSLPDGAKSNNKYLCQSGLIDKNKCVSSKIANDTCAFPYELDKCEIEVNDGVSMTNTKVSCIEYYDKESLCPQQSDSQIWNDFITLFKKEVDKFDAGSSRINYRELNRIHLNNKELFKAAYAYYNQDTYRKGANKEIDECLIKYYSSFVQ